MVEDIPYGPGPHAHYGEPLAICNIVAGRMQFPEALDLRGKGWPYDRPLGVASGVFFEHYIMTEACTNGVTSSSGTLEVAQDGAVHERKTYRIGRDHKRGRR